ncbi:MAG: CHRD domain-containing protein [Balneolaceae bacterium]
MTTLPFIRSLLLTAALLTAAALPAHAQISAQVALTGQEQVPAVRSAGFGTFTVTATSDSLFVEGEFSDLRGYYTSAHVQFGARGDRGNPIFRLSIDTIDEERKNGTFSAEKNRFALNEALRNALKEGRLYLNISTNRHQMGEIRGQIPPLTP